MDTLLTLQDVMDRTGYRSRTTLRRLIASGRPWLGKFGVMSAHRVLYVDEEMNERTLRRRVRRLGVGAKLGIEPIPFQVMSRVGVHFDANGAGTLLAALAKTGFDPEVI